MKTFLILCIISIVKLSNSAITYQLYTKMNLKMGQPLVYKNPNTVYSSNYNSAKKNK